MATLEGKKKLAEREVGLATILGILNTPVNESDDTNSRLNEPLESNINP